MSPFRGRGRVRALALVVAAAALMTGAVACGEEEHTHVKEGEPIELGDLLFNISITRFLNPTDTEDSEYLEGLPAPPPGEDYLAVFMSVENEGDDDLRLPTADEVEVEDTTGAVYEPIETESLFALDLGGPIESGGEAPESDTAARSGPVQGAFILFLVDRTVSENRPLEMLIHADGEDGTIELDI